MFSTRRVEVCCSLFAFISICFAELNVNSVPLKNGDFRPKNYVIDLDTKPELRWYQVMADFRHLTPAVRKLTDNVSCVGNTGRFVPYRKIVPQMLQPTVNFFGKELMRLFPEEYAREIVGIAEFSGIDVGEVAMINVLYDFTAFGRNHRTGGGGPCTSIVAQDSFGHIFHGRNLDYNLGELMKETTITVDFTRAGKVVYSGVTFAFYAGLLTGQKPGQFSISLNERFSGSVLDNLWMILRTRFHNPTNWVIRQALEKQQSFASAVKYLSTVQIVAPCYFIVGGTRSDEGVVVSRDRSKAADVWSLDTAHGRWYLAETNWDHWKEGPKFDRRRSAAKKSLDILSSAHLDAASMLGVISKYPVNNKETIFSTVMSAASPNVMKRYTLIRNSTNF